MSRPADWLVWTAVLAATMAACDGDDPKDAGPSGVDAAPSLAFCDTYGDQRCKRLFDCFPLQAAVVYGDSSTCAERFRTQCRIEGAVVGTGRSQASSDACVAALGSASCDDVFFMTIETCQIHGTLDPGAACGTGSQCASGFCRTPETSFCGVCEPRAAEGAVCAADQACDFPLRCSEVGRCARPGNEGADCSETVPCKPGIFYCSPGDGTCTRYGTQGGRCNEAGPGPASPCSWGLVCLPEGTGSCQPIRTARAGQACGFGADASSYVACQGSGSCIDGVCQPPGKDGEACTPSPDGDTPGCMPPAICLAGTCRLPDPAACK